MLRRSSCFSSVRFRFFVDRYPHLSSKSNLFMTPYFKFSSYGTSEMSKRSLRKPICGSEKKGTAERISSTVDDALRVDVFW